MNTAIRSRRIHVTVVGVAGLAALVAASGGLGQVTANGASPAPLLLWVTMSVLAAVSPVRSPQGRTSVSLLPALDVGAFLILGPGPACWVGVLSRIFAGFVERWSPFEDHLLDVGRAALGIGVAGIAYTALGGYGVGDPGALIPSIPALIVSVSLYMLIEVITRPDLLQGDHRRGLCPTWRSGLARAAVGDLLTVPFGLLLFLTDARMGLPGVAAFFLPLLIARYAFRLWVDSRRMHLATVRALMRAVDAGDVFTRGHSHRISTMCVRVGRQMGLPRKEIEELEYAALLHDIGRTALRREILLKEVALDPGEQDELRAHPRIACELMRSLKAFSDAAEIVLAHHEQPDGMGYPRGLTRDEIPMGSRIIMVVAAFDAMISDRPYRSGLPVRTAIDELLAHAGTQFFPEVVEALIQLYSSGRLFEGIEETARADIPAPEELLARGELPARARGEQPPVAKAAEIVPRDHPSIPNKIGVDAARGEERGLPAVIPFPVPAEDAVAEPEEAVLKTDRRRSLIVAGLSDVGCVRETNEDSFGAFVGTDPSRGCLLLLADGMGGAAAGEVASSLAVENARQAYFEDGIKGAPEEVLVRAIERANAAILQRASQHLDLIGMGSTCTALAVVGTQVHLGHVGDSRAYLAADDRITLLSRDHNLAEELRRAAGMEGEPPAEARHVLTRCLGREIQVEVDTEREPVRLDESSVLVLCSDGLHGLVGAEEIREIVTTHSPSTSCRLLVDLAKQRGGEDNITVQVARLSTP